MSDSSPVKAPPAPIKKPAIKVCGLTRADQIRDCLAAGVRYIGLNRHAPSPRFVPDAALPALIEATPAGARIYVAVAPSPETLVAEAAFGFDIFQIHFDPTATPVERVAEWSRLAGGPEKLWLAPRLAPGAEFPRELAPFASAFLIDGYSPNAFGGTGKTADWTGIARLRAEYPEKIWVVAGGLNPENLVRAAVESEADVLDLNSGVEDAPGVKNLARLRLALENLDGATTR